MSPTLGPTKNRFSDVEQRTNWPKIGHLSDSDFCHGYYVAITLCDSASVLARDFGVV